MNTRRVNIVGAGVGGLAAAIDLAAAGHQVTVFERAPEPGGKMRRLKVGGAGIDAGPTVFTMRWVFEQLFEDAGTTLADELTLQPASILARHAWTTGGELDLHADIDAAAAAIEQFAGAADARGYREFRKRSAEIYETLRDTFIAAQRPSPAGLVSRVGLGHLDAMWRTAPFKTLWQALNEHFTDPRLQQLFGRYATYVGSSPLHSPATLMLIAHVEQEGVWLVDGGMRALAGALQRVGERLGVSYRFDAHVDRILVDKGAARGVQLHGGEREDADAVVFNGDVAALGHGLLGRELTRVAPRICPSRRGLSALTWCIRGRTSGFPLHYHNVFFAGDYPREFSAIFKDRGITREPTVYVCAQDRMNGRPADGEERLLVLINAPADGDMHPLKDEQKAALRDRTLAVLNKCGLIIDFTEDNCVATTPTEFNRLFPASGGSLYGRAAHGMMASFARPGSSTYIRGLYLAGGSVHPGPGVPMAAMSGRLAARALNQSKGNPVSAR